jgi:hypothetical protein
MGYMQYKITRNGETIQAGYGIETVCEEDGCTGQIDRGLGYLCGQDLGGDEYGCGGYFCGSHLYGAPEGEHGERCARCLPEMGEDGRRIDHATNGA